MTIEEESLTSFSNYSFNNFLFLAIKKPIRAYSRVFSQIDIGVALIESLLFPSVTKPKVYYHSLKSIIPSFLISIVSNRSFMTGYAGILSPATSCALTTKRLNS